MRIAIVGATGMVGRKFIEVIEEYKIQYEEIYLFASSKSANTPLLVNGETHYIIELTESNIRKYPVDYALFSAGSSTSKTFAKFFIEQGTIVIDNSSAFRMDKDVPLVVPEVNPNDAFHHLNLIANPNCSTIQSVIPLKVVHDLFHTKRVTYTTYQAVSGSGVGGIEDLKRTEQNQSPIKYKVPIYQNVIPQIDTFLDNGFTYEEIKMIQETNKILNTNLSISATCVRVPVLNGHSVDLQIECENEIDIERLKQTLNDTPGIILMDDLKNEIYPYPLIVNGTDQVYVGRIRRDLFDSKIVRLFCVADNIRKGAASNAVQIMQLLERGNQHV